MAGLVTSATPLDCASSDHPSTNELSLLKQIIKRKSEINMQGRKREKNSHTEPHQEVALSVAELLVVDTEDGLVARKRKTARDGDLRSVRMSEAEEKSAKFAEKKKVDNRATAWQARAHDHTHSGSVRNTTRRVCNKVRRYWTDRKGRDLGWILRDFGPDEVVSRHRGLEFLKKDLMRLQGGWLNNKIIDSYLELLQLRNNRQ